MQYDMMHGDAKKTTRKTNGEKARGVTTWFLYMVKDTQVDWDNPNQLDSTVLNEIE